MKLQLSLLALIFSVTSLASCPDINGTYLQTHDSCQSSKDFSLWPLEHQTKKTTVEIRQVGCELLELTYQETRDSNQPLKVVTINLSEAQSLKVFEYKMDIGFVKPKTRVSYFGHTLKAQEKQRIIFNLNAKGDLSIKSKYTLTGLYDYVVPVWDHFVSNCKLQRLP